MDSAGKVPSSSVSRLFLCVGQDGKCGPGLTLFQPNTQARAEDPPAIATKPQGRLTGLVGAPAHTTPEVSGKGLFWPLDLRPCCGGQASCG